MRALYDELFLSSARERPSPAKALRRAVLGFRSSDANLQLYHWAPFYVGGLAV